VGFRDWPQAAHARTEDGPHLGIKFQHVVSLSFVQPQARFNRAETNLAANSRAPPSVLDAQQSDLVDQTYSRNPGSVQDDLREQSSRIARETPKNCLQPPRAAEVGSWYRNAHSGLNATLACRCDRPSTYLQKKRETGDFSCRVSRPFVD
jgi:hypothetical protein